MVLLKKNTVYKYRARDPTVDSNKFSILPCLKRKFNLNLFNTIDL